MKVHFFSLLVLLSTSCNPDNTYLKTVIIDHDYQAISTSGDTLKSNPPSPDAIAKFETRKQDFIKNPSVDNWIWYARFIAYQGKYRESIEEYSRAIEKHPLDARLYRHRGHRYITVREFDKAIADLKKAAELIQGKENEIEPDGAPNAQNIPVSTLHGNIYYHLGLAHYLKNDLEPALDAYQKAIAASKMDDNIVSATHWVYMILRRLGRDNEAEEALKVITKDMKIIENFAYHELCLFYKGELRLDEMSSINSEAMSSNDAVNYGIGNWYFYHGDTSKAKSVFESIIGQGSWASFGYIAAEVDLFNISQK